jgi:hypothetical protein
VLRCSPLGDYQRPLSVIRYMVRVGAAWRLACLAVARLQAGPAGAGALRDLIWLRVWEVAKAAAAFNSSRCRAACRRACRVQRSCQLQLAGPAAACTRGGASLALSCTHVAVAAGASACCCFASAAVQWARPSPVAPPPPLQVTIEPLARALVALPQFLPDLKTMTGRAVQVPGASWLGPFFSVRCRCMLAHAGAAAVAQLGESARLLLLRLLRLLQVSAIPDQLIPAQPSVRQQCFSDFQNRRQAEVGATDSAGAAGWKQAARRRSQQCRHSLLPRPSPVARHPTPPCYPRPARRLARRSPASAWPRSTCAPSCTRS